MDRTITAIKAQKRNPHRLNIYLDGEYALSLARIVAAWLTVGRVLTDAEIAALQEKDTVEKAFQQAMLFLSYRVRSVAEVTRNLVEKGFSEVVVEQTVARLQQNGLLNDASFAQAWVENRDTFRPRGRRILAMELRQKGVADEVIDEALGDSSGEEDLAYQAAQRQARRLAGLDRKMFRSRLAGFLGRRGFSYETIAPVVERLWSEIHSPEEQSET
jgi:regulatory protein